MSDANVRVTLEDLRTGEKETHEIKDDYLIVCAGTCYVDGRQLYANGTNVLTIKGRGA